MAGSFTDTWNGAYEGIPSDNESINLGANRIRDFKVNIRQRVQIDHSFNGDTNDGKHLQSTYRIASSDPALDPTDGCVYTKVVSGNTELFYKDSSGRVIQLTNQGLAASAFPSGTLMTFMQASPPPSWTQSAAYNDGMIRVVSGAGGGGTGGSWTISGTNVATTTTTNTSTNTNTTVTSTSTTNTNTSTTVNSTTSCNSSSSTSVSITGVSSAFAGDAITLTEANLPQHTHNVVPSISGVNQVQGSASGPTAVFETGSTTYTTDGGHGFAAAITPTGTINFNSGSATASTSTTTTATTSSPATSTSTSTTTTSSPASSSSTSNSTSNSTSTFSNDATWRPSYVNAIVAVKN